MQTLVYTTGFLQKGQNGVVCSLEYSRGFLRFRCILYATSKRKGYVAANSSVVVLLLTKQVWGEPWHNWLHHRATTLCACLERERERERETEMKPTPSFQDAVRANSEEQKGAVFALPCFTFRTK